MILEQMKLKHLIIIIINLIQNPMLGSSETKPINFFCLVIYSHWL